MLCPLLGSVPLPVRFGRSAPPALVRPPEVSTVNGMPDRSATSIANCQPPRTVFTAPPRLSSAFPLPNGSSQAALNDHCRRTSVYELPRLSSVFHGTTGPLPPVPLLISVTFSMVCAQVNAER